MRFSQHLTSTNNALAVVSTMTAYDYADDYAWCQSLFQSCLLDRFAVRYSCSFHMLELSERQSAANLLVSQGYSERLTASQLLNDMLP
jgi:hypothetical protein